MLTTPINIISRALRLNGSLGSGEVATANEIADGLDALNAMLDSWWNERLAVFAIQDQSFALTSGTADYTIGPSGVFVTGRPLKIENAFVRLSGVDYAVDIIDQTRYADINVKSLTGIPFQLYYEPTMPNGVIHLFYVPSDGQTLYISTRRQIQNFVTATDTISLPPGYVDALPYNLAVRIAPEYQKAVAPAVATAAAETKANIKRLNSTPPQQSVSDALFLGTHATDEFAAAGRYPVP